MWKWDIEPSCYANFSINEPDLPYVSRIYNTLSNQGIWFIKENGCQSKWCQFIPLLFIIDIDKHFPWIMILGWYAIELLLVIRMGNRRIAPKGKDFRKTFLKGFIVW